MCGGGVSPCLPVFVYRYDPECPFFYVTLCRSDNTSNRILTSSYRLLRKIHEADYMTCLNRGDKKASWRIRNSTLFSTKRHLQMANHL